MDTYQPLHRSFSFIQYVVSSIFLFRLLHFLQGVKTIRFDLVVLLLEKVSNEPPEVMCNTCMKSVQFSPVKRSYMIRFWLLNDSFGSSSFPRAVLQIHISHSSFPAISITVYRYQGQLSTIRI